MTYTSRNRELKKPSQQRARSSKTKRRSLRVSPERKADQVTVDKQLVEVIKKREDKKLMFGYLKSDFSLKNHQYPHKMIF
ncbi:RPL6 [Bugula neritina]|uniref:RPL6 n=1 Tax=Bugula neritina TaxID=10212 RepID=A0A7J7JHA3_BUGNE|nr:RPL6 [Bugula neritina]